MNLGMKEFVKPGQVCPNCRQVYRNELRIDIAAEVVSFVRRQYPDDTQKRVEALYLKLRALNFNGWENDSGTKQRSRCYCKCTARKYEESFKEIPRIVCIACL